MLVVAAAQTGRIQSANRNRAWPLARNQIPCALRLVATAAVGRVSRTIWSAAPRLYLGTGLLLAFFGAHALPRGAPDAGIDSSGPPSATRFPLAKPVHGPPR